MVLRMSKVGLSLMKTKFNHICKSATPFLVNLILILLTFSPKEPLVASWLLPYLGVTYIVAYILTTFYFVYKCPDAF
ncbi:hypothetical protein ALT785_320002 [Alteromonas infernus]